MPEPTLPLPPSMGSVASAEGCSVRGSSGLDPPADAGSQATCALAGRNFCVTLSLMASKRPTGAERYLGEQMRDPEYRAAYEEARRRIDQVDTLVRTLDGRREALGLTKAELARRADLAPEAVRRLFSTEAPNPTASTLAALADALELDLVPTPRTKAS